MAAVWKTAVGSALLLPRYAASVNMEIAPEGMYCKFFFKLLIQQTRADTAPARRSRSDEYILNTLCQ
jgi:hypothetical protein